MSDRARAAPAAPDQRPRMRHSEGADLSHELESLALEKVGRGGCVRRTRIGLLTPYKKRGGLRTHIGLAEFGAGQLVGEDRVQRLRLGSHRVVACGTGGRRHPYFPALTCS
jgi:hypothetical protein